MDTIELEYLISRIEKIQFKLAEKRRDHTGRVAEHDDIYQLQLCIEIIKNLIIDEDYIWQRKNTK